MAQEHIRKLTVTGQGRSYYVTIPLALIRQLKWKKGERKVVTKSGKRIIIEDWEE